MLLHVWVGCISVRVSRYKLCVAWKPQCCSAVLQCCMLHAAPHFTLATLTHTQCCRTRMQPSETGAAQQTNQPTDCLSLPLSLSYCLPLAPFLHAFSYWKWKSLKWQTDNKGPRVACAACVACVCVCFMWQFSFWRRQKQNLNRQPAA